MRTPQEVARWAVGVDIALSGVTTETRIVQAIAAARERESMACLVAAHENGGATVAVFLNHAAAHADKAEREEKAGPQTDFLFDLQQWEVDET